MTGSDAAGRQRRGPSAPAVCLPGWRVRGKTWTSGNRPADWKQQMNRWDRYYYVRVAVIIAAFALLAAALT
ncbi:hypothetical protein [Microbispora sp. ATCC PTA-5024]|uniref:hypothetical protein n=1 Tax=Microbispora sp. ATCC PTA-5024 TaxID=316330 RepID=UPI001E5BC562|nr:hypothetical protein [Microbispora sp. ATCC PTA-5024]